MSDASRFLTDPPLPPRLGVRPSGGEVTQVPTPRISPRQMPEPATIKGVRIGTWNMAGKWSDNHRALLGPEAREVWLLRAKIGPIGLPYRGTLT